jgi:hypothetical protein
MKSVLDHIGGQAVGVYRGHIFLNVFLDVGWQAVLGSTNDVVRHVRGLPIEGVRR